MRSVLGMLIGAALFVTAVAAIFLLHGPATAVVGGSFSLFESKTNRVVTSQELRGKWLLIFFGYTHCPDVCPTTLNDIGEAMAQLGPLAGRVQPLFITLDPERDTAPVLADYVSAFDPRIVGLTGTPAQTTAAAKAFGVYFERRTIGGDYYLDHVSVIHLVRPDGTYQGHLLTTAGASELTKRLRALVLKP